MLKKEKKKKLVAQFITLMKKLDSGKTIVQKKFLLEIMMMIKSLKKNTQKLEYKAFPEALLKFLEILGFKKKLISCLAFSIESDPCTEFLSIDIP